MGSCGAVSRLMVALFGTFELDTCTVSHGDACFTLARDLEICISATITLYELFTSEFYFLFRMMDAYVIGIALLLILALIDMFLFGRRICYIYEDLALASWSSALVRSINH